MKIFGFLLSFLFATIVYGGDIERVSLPLEVKSEVSKTIPEEIRGKTWNRWVSDNFVVCCLNEGKAEYLYQNLEKVKSWIFSRWGLADTRFSSECIILGVDDRLFFKKLFGVDDSKVEIRRDANGDITRTVIFLLLDDAPSKTIPGPLTEVCLAEYEQVHHIKFGWWAHRGMSILNGPLSEIRQNISYLKPKFDQNEPMFFGKSLFEYQEENWIKDANSRQLFDACALSLCLMLRKEFGETKFLSLLHAGYNNPEQVLIKQYHFESLTQFDKSFKRFMFDLSNDITKGDPDHPITPDHYLQIKQKPKK